MTHTTQKASAILRLARARIDRPEKWGQGGDRTQACALDAVEDTAWDATEHVAGDWNELRAAMLEPLHEAIGAGTLVDFNDTHTHAEVMTAFDRAIALAEREESRQ